MNKKSSVVDPLTLVRLAELRARAEAADRAKAIREANGIHFYRPHYKQDLFHRSTAIGRYARTGNRFGKSDLGAAEDVAWCLGGRLWYRQAFPVLDGNGRVVRQHEGGRDNPLVRAGIPDRPVKGLLIVVDWDKAKEIFTNREGSYETRGKLFKLIPADALGKVHTSKAGHIDQIEIKRPIEFGGGSSLLCIDTIQSYKNSKLSMESSDWDFIHVDEPCPQDMFKAASRGLMDRNGKYWFTCTPLDEMWINDRFSPQRGTIVKDASDGLSFDTKFMVTGSVYDNPYRNPEGVAEFEASLTDDERAARIHGYPLALAGTIYKEFAYDLHVLREVPAGWRDYHLPPRDYTIRVFWDYHIRLPQAVLFFATSPQGVVFVYDELYEHNRIDTVAKEILERTAGRNVMAQEIDPLAVIPHPVTGESIVDELCRYNLFFEKASKDLGRGISAVRAKLAERDHNGNPTIYFSPRLSRTLYEFSHYVYDSKTNKPKDADNHMMENLYRAVLSGLDYIEPFTDDQLQQLTRPYIVGDQPLIELPHNLIEPSTRTFR